MLFRSFQSGPKEKWGSLLGASRPGVEVYLVQSTSSGGLKDSALSSKSMPEPDSGRTGLNPIEPQKKTHQAHKPAPDMAGIEFTGVNGVLQPLPHLATQSARQSGFLGLPVPSGQVEGFVNLEMEWAMRRQAALRVISAQADFLRLNFNFPESASCAVGLERTICSSNKNGLAEMLSTLYQETHAIDPSLPTMIWNTSGYGSWFYELVN